MRTTVDLADHLLLEAKRLAANRRTSLTNILEDSLRAYLSRERQQRQLATGELRLPTVKGVRLRKGIDLDDSSSLMDEP